MNNQFNPTEFQKNRETISPITFINGDVKADNDLNSLFTLPYDLSLLSRATVNSMVVAAKESCTCSEEAFNNFLYDVNRQNVSNHVDAIYSYLIMNSRDFVFNYLSAMFNSILENTITKPRYYDEDEEYYANYSRAYYFINSGELDDTIKKTLDRFVFGSSTCKDLPPIYYYQLMNNLYFEIIVYIDTVIRRVVDRKYMNNNNRDFDKLMVHVYGENNGIKANQLTPEFKYTFATSIIREMVEKKLPDLYHGLHYIFQSAASMAYIGSNPVTAEDIGFMNHVDVKPIGVIGDGASPVNNEHTCSCGGDCHCHDNSSTKNNEKRVAIRRIKK